MLISGGIWRGEKLSRYPLQFILPSSEAWGHVILCKFVIYSTIVSIAIATAKLVEAGFVFQLEERTGKNLGRTSGSAHASDRYTAKQAENCFQSTGSHKYCASACGPVAECTTASALSQPKRA